MTEKREYTHGKKRDIRSTCALFLDLYRCVIASGGNSPRLGNGYLYEEAIKLKSAFFKCLNFEMTWLGGPVILFPSGGITVKLNMK